MAAAAAAVDGKVLPTARLSSAPERFRDVAADMSALSVPGTFLRECTGRALIPKPTLPLPPPPPPLPPPPPPPLLLLLLLVSAEVTAFESPPSAPRLLTDCGECCAEEEALPCPASPVRDSSPASALVSTPALGLLEVELELELELEDEAGTLVGGAAAPAPPAFATTSATATPAGADDMGAAAARAVVVCSAALRAAAAAVRSESDSRESAEDGEYVPSAASCGGR